MQHHVNLSACAQHAGVSLDNHKVLHSFLCLQYIVMCEADHLFMRPMPNMMNGDISGAALFTCVLGGHAHAS